MAESKVASRRLRSDPLFKAMSEGARLKGEVSK